jgi:valyl-tRNA synthetase
VAEELWQSLPHEGVSIVVAPYPTEAPLPATGNAASHRLAQSLVRTVRNLRGELNLPPAQKVRAVALTNDPLVREAWAANLDEIVQLARLDTLDLASQDRPHPAIAGVTDGGTVYLPLQGVVDLGAERERLMRDRAATLAEVERLTRRLADPGFRQKAPGAVVEETEVRRAQAQARSDRLAERLEELS